jgi:regulatory protein YycI of two-component signal transduction system YycFG
MQKGQQKQPSTEGAKTGIAIVDNALLVFSFLYEKLVKDTKAFFLIILLAVCVYLGYLYLNEAKNADIRVTKAVSDVSIKYEERILKLENSIKTLQLTQVKTEEDCDKMQKSFSERIDKVVDKLLKIGKK